MISYLTLLAIMSVEAIYTLNPLKNRNTQFEHMPYYVHPNGKMVFDFCTDRQAKIAQPEKAFYFTLHRKETEGKIAGQVSKIHHFLTDTFVIRKTSGQGGVQCFQVYLPMNKVPHYGRMVYNQPLYYLTAGKVKPDASSRKIIDSSKFAMINPATYQLEPQGKRVNPAPTSEIDIDGMLQSQLNDHSHAMADSVKRKQTSRMFNGKDTKYLKLPAQLKQRIKQDRFYNQFYKDAYSSLNPPRQDPRAVRYQPQATPDQPPQQPSVEASQQPGMATDEAGVQSGMNERPDTRFKSTWAQRGGFQAGQGEGTENQAGSPTLQRSGRIGGGRSNRFAVDNDMSDDDEDRIPDASDRRVTFSDSTKLGSSGGLTPDQIHGARQLPTGQRKGD